MEALAVIAVLVVLYLLGRRQSPPPSRSPQELAKQELLERARRGAEGDFNLSARLPEIREYVRMGSQVLPIEKLTLPPVVDLPSSDGSRLEFAKRSIQLAVHRFGMPMPPMKVRFSRMPDGHAGSVQAHPDGTWAVDLDSSIQSDLEAILSVAAHEVAHVALLRRGITLAPTQRNEELTDTTAVLAGFGPIMLRTVLRESILEGEDRLELHSRKLGYLPPRALAFLSALRVEMAGGDAGFYVDHVAEWQRDAINQYIALRDEWREEASLRRGAPLNCFACGIQMRLPKVTASFRLKCRTCSFQSLVSPAS